MTDTEQPAAQVGPTTAETAGADHVGPAGPGRTARRATSRAHALHKGGKRRGKVRKRHTVAKVLVSTLVALGLVSGLSVAYLYRDLSNNLNGINVEEALGDRVEKVVPEGPKEPLNILVMGDDTREGAGNAIDGEGGGGSDTTILVHLSADRKRAYGISIPRDSMVDRPACLDENGDQISPAASYVMWNQAFGLGGPACTIRQVEATTGISVDHFVVVDFAGFQDMVDAIGGVEVCIPETWDDREHGIYLEEGTRRISGKEALSYVRVRAIGDGSDIGRLKRQQAFIGSMAHQVLSSNTLANPIKVVRFLRAATKSLTVDEGLSNLTAMGQLGYEFRDIGLDKIQFLTIPWGADPEDPNRIVWADEARQVWNRIKHDRPLPERLTGGAIKVDSLPGTGSASAAPSGSPSEDSSEEPSDEASPSEGGEGGGGPVVEPSPAVTSGPSEEELAALESAGLCT